MKEKHLEFIQTVIERMARNSFQAKAWGITTATASLGLLVIKATELHKVTVLVPIFILVIFGILDAYYLYLERGYRYLYNAVICSEDKLQIKEFDMNIPSSRRGCKMFLKVVFSKTIGGFYIALIALVAVFCVCVFKN